MGNLMRWHNRPAEKADVSSPRHLPAAVRRPEETGFTLIEVVIAFTILGVLFLAIEWAAIGASTASTTAAQRATATSLAAQAIAQAQALPFTGPGGLQSGLNSCQLYAAMGSWPEVAKSGTDCTNYTYTLQLSGLSPVPILVTYGAASGQPPLVPFSSTVPVGGVSYNVAVFPSPVAGNPALVTLTAIVIWSAPPIHNQTTTVQQVEVGAQ